MNPRTLRERINILKPHTRRDQASGADVVEYKRHHRKVPANKQDVSGGEGRRGQQLEANVSTVFIIQRIKDIATDYQIEIPGPKKPPPETSTSEIYDIKAILDRDGKGQWLEVQCSKVS